MQSRQSQQKAMVVKEAYGKGVQPVGDEKAESRILQFPIVRSRSYTFAKRTFDVISAIGLFLVLFPFLIVLALCVKLSSKGPVLYRHKRIGQKGRAIYLLKFRSMVMDADKLIEQFTPAQKKEWEENFKLEKDPRITKIGAFLRRTSLDELPQLLNIIKGDLSVVGPRPVIEAELEKYGYNKARFLSAKPGLTGYWQVNGRSAVTYEERMDMELYYVGHASMALDMKILWKTIGVVLHGKGAI